MKNQTFSAIFERLKSILKAYEGPMVEHISVNGALQGQSYELRDPQNDGWYGQFAILRVHEKHVSLMVGPLGMEKGLTRDLSPVLQKALHGKNTFHLKTANEAVFQELSHVIERAFAYYEIFHMNDPFSVS